MTTGDLIQKPLPKYRLNAMERIIKTIQRSMKPYLTPQQLDFLGRSNVMFQGALLKTYVGENQQLALAWDGHVFFVRPPFNKALEFIPLEDSKLIYTSLAVLVGRTASDLTDPFAGDDRFLNLDFDVQLEQLWVRSARGTRIHYKGR